MEVPESLRDNERCTEIRTYISMANAEEKVKVTVFIPAWARAAIKQLLAPTGETQTGWIEGLILDKLAEHGFRPPENYNSLADLVESNWDFLVQDGSISNNELEEIRKGGRATTETVLRLALLIKMTEKEVKELQPIPASFRELLSSKKLEDLVADSAIPTERLEAISNGEKPTDEELVGLACVLKGWRTEDLIALRQKLFPCNNSRSKSHNGSR